MAHKGDKANQHANNHRHLKTGQNILAQHFKEALGFVQLFQFPISGSASGRPVNDRKE